MVYGILNFVLAALLLWLSLYADKKMGNKDNIGSNPVIIMNTLLGVACLLMGFAVMFSMSDAPERLTTFLGKCMYMFMGMYAINFCVYCITFPSFERGTVARAATIAGYVFCFWLLFTKIYAVNITSFLGIRVDAMSLFTGRLTNYFPYSWYNFYEVLMTFCLPSLSVIIMLLRSENRTSRLDHQKTILTSIALVLSWVSMKLVFMASERVALFSSIVLAGFVLAQAVVVMAATQNFLYDFYYASTLFLKGVVCYVVPSLVVGIIFPFIWKLYGTATFTFFLLFLVVIAGAVVASYELQKIFKRFSGFHSNQYASLLEEDLSQMDYSDDPKDVVKKMHDIFTQNIGMASFKVLIDQGNGELCSVYDQEGDKRIKINEKDRVFDVLLNMDSQIVLKSSVETGYHFMSIKTEFLDFFKRTRSDAIILLNEGRHLLGVLVLGERSGGNIYSDYDYEVFKKLYSYLWVFGYYLKNIGNQEIVGTVNREIHMSEQIIESIQGNMDFIKNKKYDVGNIMIHAHNIGGEFIDLVKLSDDKHVFVMGDLSGKGISASMSMVIVKSIIRTYLHDTSDFKRLVEKVNQFIRFNLPKGTFMEGVFGLIDFKDNTVYYINCGIPAMFLYTRAYNNIIEIQGEGHVLGFVKDISPYIKVKKVKLNPGDILVTCTDGLIDAHSPRGEQFGKDRIQKCITENTSLPAQSIAEASFESLKEFITTVGPEDDVSVLVMKLSK